MDEPDLDRPGWPSVILIDGEPFEVEKTVRENLQDLATASGSEENVTLEACEAAGLDWRDWSYFVVEMVEQQRWTDEHMASYEANYEAIHGEPVPGFAELRARRRKDKLGLRHLDPEPTDGDEA